MTVTMQQPSNIHTTTITSMNNVDAMNSATMKNGMEQQQHIIINNKNHGGAVVVTL